MPLLAMLIAIAFCCSVIIGCGSSGGSKPKLIGLEVTELPDKKNYIVGESLDPKGMEVTLYYNKGVPNVLTEDDFEDEGIECLPEVFNTTGTSITVTVSLGALSDTFTVTVDDKALTALTMTTPPADTTFDTGDRFSPAGIVFTQTHEGNETRTATFRANGIVDMTPAGVPVPVYTFNPPLTTPLTEAITEIEIIYNANFKIVIPVTVTDVSPTSVALNKPAAGTNSITMYKNTDEFFWPVFTPSNTTNQAGTWTLAGGGVVTEISSTDIPDGTKLLSVLAGGGSATLTFTAEERDATNAVVSTSITITTVDLSEAPVYKTADGAFRFEFEEAVWEYNAGLKDDAGAHRWGPRISIGNATGPTTQSSMSPEFRQFLYDRPTLRELGFATGNTAAVVEAGGASIGFMTGNIHIEFKVHSTEATDADFVIAAGGWQAGVAISDRNLFMRVNNPLPQEEISSINLADPQDVIDYTKGAPVTVLPRAQEFTRVPADEDTERITISLNAGINTIQFISRISENTDVPDLDYIDLKPVSGTANLSFANRRFSNTFLGSEPPAAEGCRPVIDAYEKLHGILDPGKYWAQRDGETD